MRKLEPGENLFCSQSSSLFLVFTCLIESLGYKSADWEQHKYFKPPPPRTSPRNAKTSARLQKPLRAVRLPHRGSEATTWDHFRSTFSRIQTQTIHQILQTPKAQNLSAQCKNLCTPAKTSTRRPVTPQRFWNYPWTFLQFQFQESRQDHSSNTLNAEKQKTCAQKPKLLHACTNLYVCSGFPYRGDWNYHMVFFSSSFQELDQNFFKCEKARAWRKPFLFKNVSNFLPSS